MRLLGKNLAAAGEKELLLKKTVKMTREKMMLTMQKN
jgi:hypothetical protein